MCSLSMFIELNNSNQICYEKTDNTLLVEGMKIYEDGVTILRFHNGLLDGDIFDTSGNYITTKPAVESVGHIEYWRKGCLHRDDNLPAVSTNGFTQNEFWVNGEQIDL